jgi:hypothetical protein
VDVIRGWWAGAQPPTREQEQALMRRFGMEPA